MVAGLPGTGIGGLFYLLMAVWMPVHAAVRKLRGLPKRRSWRLVARGSAMAVGIIGGIWITGWGLGEFFQIFGRFLPPALRPGHVISSHAMVILSAIFSMGTLVAVTGGVHCLRYIVRLREAETTGRPAGNEVDLTAEADHPSIAA